MDKKFHMLINIFKLAIKDGGGGGGGGGGESRYFGDIRRKDGVRR